MTKVWSENISTNSDQINGIKSGEYSHEVRGVPRPPTALLLALPAGVGGEVRQVPDLQVAHAVHRLPTTAQTKL